MAEKAIRVKLSTDKTVLIRVPLIKHQEQAMRLVGTKAGDNKELHAFLTSIELIKLLLAQVDDKKYTAQDPKDLDELFTIQELTQLGKAMQEFTGGGKDFLPQMEAVTIGD